MTAAWRLLLSAIFARFQWGLRFQIIGAELGKAKSFYLSKRVQVSWSFLNHERFNDRSLFVRFEYFIQKSIFFKPSFISKFDIIKVFVETEAKIHTLKCE